MTPAGERWVRECSRPWRAFFGGGLQSLGGVFAVPEASDNRKRVRQAQHLSQAHVRANRWAARTVCAVYSQLIASIKYATPNRRE